jgi:cytochrome c2
MRTRVKVAGFLVGAWACAAAEAQVPAAPSPREAEVGAIVFAAKQCDRCHRPRGAPGLGPPLEELRRPQGQMELAGRLWNHVPAMAAALGENGVTWPAITAAEMGQLMAFLSAQATRDAVPDPSQGQVTLLRKSCLKCHSLRHEGGSVQPDLATHRPDYESAAAWAATMWTHTPRMAEMARRQGVPYPRFTGSEMANLVGYLRSATVPAGGSPPPGR